MWQLNNTFSDDDQVSLKSSIIFIVELPKQYIYESLVLRIRGLDCMGHKWQGISSCRRVAWKIRIFHSSENSPSTLLHAKTAAQTYLRSATSRWRRNRGDIVGDAAGGTVLEGGDPHTGEETLLKRLWPAVGLKLFCLWQELSVKNKWDLNILIYYLSSYFWIFPFQLLLLLISIWIIYYSKALGFLLFFCF